MHYTSLYDDLDTHRFIYVYIGKVTHTLVNIYAHMCVIYIHIKRGIYITALLFAFN